MPTQISASAYGNRLSPPPFSSQPFATAPMQMPPSTSRYENLDDQSAEESTSRSRRHPVTSGASNNRSSTNCNASSMVSSSSSSSLPSFTSSPTPVPVNLIATCNRVSPVLKSSVHTITRSFICPKCQIGVLVKDFTCCGILLAVLFFPIGIPLCFLLRTFRCNMCSSSQKSPQIFHCVV